MRFISNVKKACPKYDIEFESGDLIVPNRGIQFAFQWRDGLEVRYEYTYKKANSAEENYFWKQLINGYGLLGVVSIQEMLSLNIRTFATNLDEL